MCLLVIGVNALTFYVLPQSDYDHRANLLAAAVLLAMLPFALSRRLHVLLVNMALVVAISLIVYIATETGGINSSALVFLSVLAVPALFFLGPRGAGVWMGLLLAVYLWLLMANLHGDMVRPPPNSGTLLWALSNHVFAAASLVLVLRLYDRLHHTQLAVVQERNRELEATQTHLMEAQAHKDEFIAAVGHELRTPMNAILGLNGVLREEFADDPVNAETAEHIRRSTEHLLHVVNDILDFAQLQAGRVNFFPEACLLAPWLDATVQPFKARAQAKGLAWLLQLAPALPPEVWIDRQRLAQILGYLLDNALKFTRGNPAARIAVTGVADGGWNTYCVADDGVGFDPRYAHKLFTLFQRLHRRDDFEGAGVGLALVHRIVQRHGGVTRAEGEVGRGARIYFTLPGSPKTNP